MQTRKFFTIHVPHTGVLNSFCNIYVYIIYSQTFRSAPMHVIDAEYKISFKNIGYDKY